MEKINGARTIAADSLHFDAVILADGDYPTHPLPLKVLEEARFLVCCDKAGMEYIERTGKTPDAIVGDGDSLPEAFKHRYADIWHKVDEQDYNDLSKAARYMSQLSKIGVESEADIKIPKDYVYIGSYVPALDKEIELTGLIVEFDDDGNELLSPKMFKNTK